MKDRKKSEADEIMNCLLHSRYAFNGKISGSTSKIKTAILKNSTEILVVFSAKPGAIRETKKRGER